MRKNGTLIILSGFAGTGKGTVVKTLLETYGDSYALSVSATTRSPREGEKEGVNYFFKSEKEFLEMVDGDEFLEYAKYVDNFYGTPRPYVENMLSEGKNVILEIEMQGALDVKEKIPEALLIFLVPPSIKELYRRLKERGTESEDVIRKRLCRAKEEVKVISGYDYVVENDDINKCAELVHWIVTSAKYQARYASLQISDLEAELEDHLKGDK